MNRKVADRRSVAKIIPVGQGKGSEIRVKRLIAILLLAIMLTASIAVIAGCGGGGSNSSQGLSEPEQVVDNAMREAMNGNIQPMIDMVPPELKDQYTQLLQQGGASLSGSKIIEVHYSTDETDADHVTVNYWGIIQTPDGQQTTVTEDAPESIPLVRQDGQWYFDLSSAASQAQGQATTQ